jgi:NitT/TauT family transport system substrate-binding protein
MKRWLSLFLSVVLAVAIVGCQPRTQTTLPEADTSPIRLGTNPWPGYGLVWIAEETGIFERLGVPIEVVRYETTEPSQIAFIQKQVDLVTGVYADALSMLNAGTDARVIYVFDNSNGSDALVVRGGITDMRDLVDQTIGVNFGTFSHAFVLAGLEANGVPPFNIRFFDLSEDAVPGAIDEGIVSAGHTWEPYLSEALANDDRILFTSADTPGIIADTLVAHAEIMESRPDDVQLIVQALVEAHDWWLANEAAGNTIVGNGIGVPPEEMPAVMAGVKLFNLADNLAAFDQNNPAPTSLWVSGLTLTELFMRVDLYDEVPNLLVMLQPQFVQALASETTE